MSKLHPLSRHAHYTAMAVITKPKKVGKAACADCRKSVCTRTGKGWEFVCTLKRALEPATCPDFADSRKPTWEGLAPVA